jgi:hypothetical protein
MLLLCIRFKIRIQRWKRQEALDVAYGVDRDVKLQYLVCQLTSSRNTIPSTSTSLANPIFSEKAAVPLSDICPLISFP